jgi:DNA-binding beta-propeller fold protein YncE
MSDLMNVADVVNSSPLEGGASRAAAGGNRATVYDKSSTLLPLPFSPHLSATDRTAILAGCRPSGMFFAVSHSEGLLLQFATCPLRLIRAIPVGSNPLQVALTPDGSQALVSRFDEAIAIVNTTTGQLTGTINTLGIYAQGISVMPDGTQAWVTSYTDENPTIAVIDLATRRTIRSIPTGNFYPRTVVLTPDGSQAWVNFLNGGIIKVYDTLTGEQIGQVSVPGTAQTGIAFNPTGTRAYVAAVPDRLIVFDTAGLTEVARITVVSGPIDVKFSNGLIYVNGSLRQGGISVVDPVSNTLLGNVVVPPSTGMTVVP